MRLQVKFSLIFLLVFAVQLGVAAYVCDGFLQRSARDQVIRQARLMMESSLAARTNTRAVMLFTLGLMMCSLIADMGFLLFGFD